MAKRRKNSRSPIITAVTLALVIVAYVFFCAVDFYNIDLGVEVDLGGINVFELFGGKHTVEDEAPAPVPEGEEVLFHFIDVGQGDAILVTSKDGNMLIDTSISGARDELTAYLASANVTVLDYLVLTHPDADHIGNADYVIDNYDVKNIILTDHASTSKTYERMLDAIERSSANVIEAEAGYQFSIGALTNTIIAPNDDYDDPNEMSVVIKATYGTTSVMLTGDAEVESEEDTVKKWDASSLESDILKVGHHGSKTSTTDEFLDAVDPDIAVISCGLDNKYGHPHDETIQKLEEKGIEIYRTDLHGSIVFKTDGQKFVLVEFVK